ncbi:hypothetical protein [Limosilactobacillus sp.]|uniref:hypothetical protein n=1 Tax=Limosilactobacillus sp. TaxID=2773925 RepID=UPI00345E8975
MAKRRWWLVAFVVIVALVSSIALYHHSQLMRQQHRIYVQQHRLVGTYYAYVHDDGVIHKVRLRIGRHHRATLKIVDSTQGESTHVRKINHLRFHPQRHTVTAPAYPSAVPDHYRHMGTTIRLTSGGKTTAYYRHGTFRQKQLERHFAHRAE